MFRVSHTQQLQTSHSSCSDSAEGHAARESWFQRQACDVEGSEPRCRHSELWFGYVWILEFTSRKSGQQTPESLEIDSGLSKQLSQNIPEEAPMRP